MSAHRLDLGGTWKRFVDGRQIDTVSVPGAYPPAGEYVLEREIDWPWTDQPGMREFLCTEGVLASAEFIVNGRVLGKAGPWAPYQFELPKGLLKQKNVVQARIRDTGESFGPTPGRHFDGGLVRNVYLEQRPATFLEGMTFRYELKEDHNSATCTVGIELNGSAKPGAQITLTERHSGRVVARATATGGTPASFTIEWPKLWSPQSPNLYTLTASLSDGDTLTEAVGFRRIETRGRDFYLNGQRLVLKGVCRHEFTSASSYSPTEAEVRQDLALIKHAGFNYIRLVHSPQAPCVCRIAAELGILVSEEPGTCFHDLADEAVAAPAVECMRRIVLRDRNVPSILAWLIYNECNPNSDYAVRVAKMCREMDPGCRLGFADCSNRNDEIIAMTKAADLTFYGINTYNNAPKAYVEKMAAFTDRPLVITEWGGYIGIGNPRILKTLCDAFVKHSRQDQADRIAGCSFWAWADYEEYSRAEPAAIKGWTVEGLLDQEGKPRTELHTMSMMCFDMEHPAPAAPPRIEILAAAPKREGNWQPVSLANVEGDQSMLDRAVEELRQKYSPRPPAFGDLLVDGIEFACRAQPLLLGDGREELFIPIGRKVKAIAILGHVAVRGGYPASAIWSVHHKTAEPARELGSPASEYEFVFENGSETQPLRHGIEVLRSNNICRWWKTTPRSSASRPAVQTVIHPSYEILRLDLWERSFAAPKVLKGIRWKLTDRESIQAMYGVSVLTE